MRDNGMCDFTDEELERADKCMCKIKTGFVKYVGNVEMWIDPYLPVKTELKVSYNEKV